MAQRAADFLHEIETYLGMDGSGSKEEVFRAWLEQALGLWIKTEEPSSFAPFDDRFRNQSESLENFRGFVEGELVGIGLIGRRTAQLMVADALRSLLSDVSNPASPFVLLAEETSYLSRKTIDIFHSLHTLDRAKAIGWFCSYLASWRNERDVGGVALPIELFQTAHRFSGTDEHGAALARTMFDWCKDNADEEQLWMILPEVLCLRLSAISRSQQKRAGREAVDVLRAFAEPTVGSQTMAEALAAAYSLLPDQMERWQDAREDLHRALTGIDLPSKATGWMKEAHSPLYYDLAWKTGGNREDRRWIDAKNNKVIGMLAGIMGSKNQPDAAAVRSEFSEAMETI